MKTDTAVPQFDPSRFVETPFGWYALTREPSDLGPFPTKSQASNALVDHIRLHTGLNPRNPEDHYSGFTVHDPENCAKNNCGRCAEALAFAGFQAIA